MCIFYGIWSCNNALLKLVEKKKRIPKIHNISSQCFTKEARCLVDGCRTEHSPIRSYEISLISWRIVCDLFLIFRRSCGSITYVFLLSIRQQFCQMPDTTLFWMQMSLQNLSPECYYESDVTYFEENQSITSFIGKTNCLNWPDCQTVSSDWPGRYILLSVVSLSCQIARYPLTEINCCAYCQRNLACTKTRTISAILWQKHSW